MQEININWDAAPEGVTHIFVDDRCDINSDGTPRYNQQWEKWENGVIFDWNGSDGWNKYDLLDEMPNDALSKRIPRPQKQGININEYWFIKLPVVVSLIEAKILDVTEKTVLIQDVNGGGNQKRYAISDIEWIEKAVN